MEGLVYLSVRVGCAAYLLYKVWGQKKKVHELCDLLYTPVKKRANDIDVTGAGG
ncbi:DUF4122 domain-containing protein [Parabacteroides distasonis]|nr:DUF4122 domain-containing protein [Parabacteroides distasonis]